MSLEALDKAEVDADGNVCLTDGRWMHSLQFEPVDVPGPWTGLDEAIIWLTIKAFDPERLFVRHHFPFADAEGQPVKYRCVFIDYSILHTLHEPNVKALTRHINDNIATLPRQPGKKPFQRVAISRVRSTLRIAGAPKFVVTGKREPHSALPLGGGERSRTKTFSKLTRAVDGWTTVSRPRAVSASAPRIRQHRLANRCSYVAPRP